MINTITKKKSKNLLYLYVSMFLISFSLFLYEVLLTRLFSVILNFNLVFLVISFSILGSGIGGILAYKKLKGNNHIEPQKLIIRYSVWIPISILGTIFFMYYIPYLNIYTIYAFIGSIPFIIGGVVISSMFRQNISKSSNLYFMNLIGSALGSVALIPLMNRFGFMGSVIGVTIVSLLGTILICCYYKENKKIVIIGLCIIFLTMIFGQDDLIKKLEMNFKAYHTSPNTVIDFLKKTAEKPLGISFSKWDAISRTDVIETTNENEKIIVTDGGASAPIIRFDGNIKSVEYLKKEINYIPFAFGNNDKTLVIGSGGGKDVLFALLGESKDIDAVEINSSTIEAVNKFKQFSGDIYNRPEVSVYNQDGRNFIEKSEEKYDNIYLSMVMTNAVENTMYSLSENYIYTYEAFKEYFNHLGENGKLSFMMHGNMDLLKIVNTGIEVLLDKGVKPEEVTDYFVIINGVSLEHKNMHSNRVSMPLVIFKNNPFSEEEIEGIKGVSKEQNREIIHYPGEENEFYKLIKDGKLTYKEALSNIQFNAKPIKDNSPFFYNYTKFLPLEIVYVFLGIICIWFVIRKVYFKKKEYKEIAKYFNGLGIAYMLVEIPIIQKMVLYFGNPSFTFSIILFSILLSSGLGSLISGNKYIKRFTENSSYYLLITSIIILIIALSLNKVIEITNDFAMTQKVIIGFLIILPMGVLMGIPFPIGISKLQNIYKEEDMIPLMWGANGIFSVIGSILAIVLSIKVGFNITIYIGAMVYLFLYITNPLKERGN